MIYFLLTGVSQLSVRRRRISPESSRRSRANRLFLRGMFCTTLGALAQSCDALGPSGTIGEGSETEPATVIASADPVSPDREARIRGTGLHRVTELVVDKVRVGFRVVSPEEIAFSPPTGRLCDTAGRPIEIVANGAIRHTTTVAVNRAVRLEVGESRILSADDLACVALPAEAARYVLTASNFSRERVIESLFRFRTYVAAPDTMPVAELPRFSVGGAGVSATAHAGGGISDHPRLPADLPRQSIRVGGNAEPRVFDPRYRTAKVGDTIPFVAWNSSLSVSAQVVDQVPTYEAVVVAVTPGQVIVADLRDVNASDYLEPEVQSRLTSAAEIADRYQRSAMRMLFGSTFEFPQGAGGRQFAMLVKLPANMLGASGGIDLLGPSYSRWTSDIFLTYLTSEYGDPRYSAEQIAGTIIHENAHLADTYVASRLGRPQSAGWISEALAVRASEVAARLAFGRASGAPLPTGAWPRGVPRFETSNWPTPNGTQHPLWGPVGSSSGVGTGAYTRGARVLMYADEMLGLTGFEPGQPTLFERMLASGTSSGEDRAGQLRDWGIDAVARQLGRSAEDVLEQATLAELTDDLLPSTAATHYGLGQVLAWDLTGVSFEQRANFAHFLPGGDAKSGEATAPGGAANYWFIETFAGKGLSIRGSAVALRPHHRVRLTRLK